MRRRFAHLVLALSIVAAVSFSIRAQELKDRQLIPAYDFTTVQMPVEIVAIKLNGKDVLAGEKINGDDNWLRGVSFTLKNISDEPIVYTDIGIQLPQPNGFVVYSLHHGVDVSRGETRTGSPDSILQPGQTVDIVLTPYRYKSFLYVLAQANAPTSFETAKYYIEKICFEHYPDVIWQGGFLKKRNLSEVGRFDTIGRYVLRDKLQ